MEPCESIRFERSDGIGTLSLSRPEKRNALNPQMWRGLTELGEELASDASLRCLVIAGEGPSFCAGMDVAEGLLGTIADWADQPAEHRAPEFAAQIAGLFNWIPRLDCPSVAAVRGHALGGGLQLALACDFRVFASDAQVGLSETRYGIIPDMGATYRLPRIVGEARARELILLGEVIDADEALRIGLANRVVDVDKLLEEAHTLAERLAALAPLAVGGARRAIEAGRHLDSAHSFQVALQEQIRCLESEDFKEARRALGEGRPPQWMGR